MDVVVGIVTKGSHVALVRRAKSEGNLSWQFPAGKIEEGEDENSAVIREVQEESEVTCTPMEKLGTRDTNSKDVTLHYWACEYVEGEIRQHSNEEISAAKWATFDEMFQLITTPIFPPVLGYLENKINNGKEH